MKAQYYYERSFMSAGRKVPNKPATNNAPTPHQPGQAVFKAILPEEVDSKPFPAFPPSARLAIVVGEPLQEGPYTMRVKVPGAVTLMPHRHPEDRVYTVISGGFYIGLGDEFDPEKLQAYPPGSVIILPGDTSHFHCAKAGEYITQVRAIGPLGLESTGRTIRGMQAKQISPPSGPRDRRNCLKFNYYEHKHSKPLTRHN